MLEWLVIGGGIHGTYLSNLLIHEIGVRPSDLRTLDPHRQPLFLWDRHADACGMNYLRSPSTHNIDLPVLSLYRFAKEHPTAGGKDFVPLYNRPSLGLFRRHCRAVIEARGLKALRIVGRAQVLTREGKDLVVETETDRIRTRRMLLAIGLTEQPRWPGWARRLASRGAPVAHVFSPGFRRAAASPKERTIVVGGGLAALQTALALHRESDGPVAVLSRHRLREVPFDFNPCWIGPKCMRGFVRMPLDKRRPVIDAARRPGTAPADVMAEYQSAVAESRRFSLLVDRVAKASYENGTVRLETAGGSRMSAERLVLATGFDPRRPGGRFIDRAVSDMGLPTAACGYPLVGDDLQWHRGLFVTGPLAELRVGPCARNIAGARNAGRLLLAYLKGASSG